MIAIPSRVLVVLVLVTSVISQSMVAGRKSMLGFTEQSASSQALLEARFDESLSSTNMLAWLKRLTPRPHHLGSP